MALGANLGDPLQQLRRAADLLGELGEVTGRSAIYETEPVGGPAGQPPYLNAVLLLAPNPGFEEPERLMDEVLEVERRLGRVRGTRWGPRTIDLDLLDLDGRVEQLPNVTVPHPRLAERAFVLAPLCELDPTWRHPQLGLSACELLGGLNEQGVRRTELAW